MFFYCFTSSTGMALPSSAFTKKNSLTKCDCPKPSNSFCRSRCFSSFSFKKCHIEFTRFSALPIQWNVFHKKNLFPLFLSTISIKLLFNVLDCFLCITLAPLTKCTPILFTFLFRFRSVDSYIFLFFFNNSFSSSLCFGCTIN